MLVKTDENVQPDSKYMMSGNKISVRTMGLRGNFKQIKDDLDNIAKEIIYNLIMNNQKHVDRC